MNEQLIIDIIRHEVCAWKGIGLNDLHSDIRVSRCAEARRLASYFIRRYTKCSLKKTGSIFGRDHATIIHHCKKVKNFCETYHSYRDEVKELEERILERLKDASPDRKKTRLSLLLEECVAIKEKLVSIENEINYLKSEI